MVAGTSTLDGIVDRLLVESRRQNNLSDIDADRVQSVAQSLAAAVNAQVEVGGMTDMEIIAGLTYILKRFVIQTQAGDESEMIEVVCDMLRVGVK